MKIHSSQHPPHSSPRWLITLVFCVFAGTIAETFITASTSPTHILRDPLTVPFNIVFYGTFDLLAREIIVRRRAGLVSVLLLGAAYGFINEGVAAGTWYVVHPQGYVFIGGIDWAWALSLTIFHTIISVITPIAFIEMLFPMIQGQSLIHRRGGVICAVLLLSCIVVAIVALAPLPLPFLPYRVSVLVVAILFSFAAWAAPSKQAANNDATASAPMRELSAPTVATTTLPFPSPPTARPLPGLWRLRFAGFLAMFAYFALTVVFPVVMAMLLQSQPSGLIIAQGVDCAVFLALAALVIWRGWTWSQRAGWSPRQNLALLMGGVTFTTLLLNLTEAPMGEAFSTLPFYALLIALTLVWRRRAVATSIAV